MPTLPRRGAQPRRGGVAAWARRRGLRHRSRIDPVRVDAGRRAGARRHRTRGKGVVGHRDTGWTCRGMRSAVDDALPTCSQARPRLIAVAAEISEPGNAGTLIRIADAMGADAVVFAGHSVDPYNGKCLRASAGSIFAIPVVSETDAGERFPRCRMRVCGCWPPPSTAPPALMTPSCRADGVAVRTRIPRPARRIGGCGDRPRSDSDGRRSREPQRRCGRGDLPVPERAGAPRIGGECADSSAARRHSRT